MSATLAIAPNAAAPGPVPRSVLDSVTARLAATAEAFDRSAEFPRANFDILAQEGLVGWTVSPRYGGGGAGWTESLRVLSAVARGEPSTALAGDAR